MTWLVRVVALEGVLAAAIAVGAPARPVENAQALRLGQAGASLCAPSARGQLRGDVSGDGEPDLVRVVAESVPVDRCRYWLVAEIGSRRYRAVVPWRFSPVPAIPWLDALANVNRYPGADVVVMINSGAAIRSVMVFTYRKANLVPMRGRSFAYGPAGLHAAGVDCAPGRRGNVVSTFAERTATGGWDAERQFFETRGDLFVATRTVKARVKSLSVFHEFDDQPPGLLGSFPSCVVRRVTR